MKKECEHDWSLDEAAGASAKYTQLWWGCSKCFATRFIVLNIGLQDANNVWLTTVKDGGIKEASE